MREHSSITGQNLAMYFELECGGEGNMEQRINDWTRRVIILPPHVVSSAIADIARWAAENIGRLVLLCRK